VHHSVKIMFDKTFTVDAKENERCSVANCPHHDTFTRMDVVVQFRQNRRCSDQVKKNKKVDLKNVGYLIDQRKW
jgi:hypothetical protein